ncbi:MAG: FadR/GntR family transcriptional regulator, partial [Chloroflexota bacterium]
PGDERVDHAGAGVSTQRAGRAAPGRSDLAPRQPGRPKVSRAGIPEQIADHLVRRIVEEGLPPGTMLPTEQDLVREFGVGKSAVREAVRIVATKGLVEVVQGSGTRVAPHRNWNLIDPELVAMVSGSVLSMGHLMEVRRTLEPDIAAHAAARRTPSDLAQLETIVKQTVADGDDTEAIVAHDLAFHEALAESTDNPLYMILLSSTSELQLVFRKGVVRSHSGRTQGLQYHHRILAAVRERDSKLAHDLMVDHIERVAEDWRLAMEQTPEPPPTGAPFGLPRIEHR